MIDDIKKELISHITLDQKAASRFFKVSQGSYAAHDQFLGITVPHLRKIAKKYKDASIQVIQLLLHSPYNEERLLALYLLINHFQKADDFQQNKLYHFYLEHIHFINNWNLVDASAHYILGHYLFDKDRSFLDQLAASKILWERRMAIVATWYFIRKHDCNMTFELAIKLLNDKEDLIHKAVGWMLREAGKKDQKQLICFLEKYVKIMPKTMLRYAMEKISDDQKKHILHLLKTGF